MLDAHRIETVAIERGGSKFEAAYYVDHGVIYANVIGQPQAAALTTNPYDQTRAMLEARILEVSGRSRRI